MSDTIADIARRIKQGFRSNPDYDEADVREALTHLAPTGTDRAHMGVVPFCPKCGSGAIFLELPITVGADVPIACSDGRCGWRGGGPRTIPVPVWR